MDYLGCSFDINIQPSTVQIDWTVGGSCDQLDVIPDALKNCDTLLQNRANGRATFARGPFTIIRKTPLSCPLMDEIGKPTSTGTILTVANVLVFIPAFFLALKTLLIM